MSSEHFIKYLKNPKLLNEVTYDELSQMREKYPYSHILHYLLFLKSQQSPADLAEHKKNASIFAVDNNKIFEEIKQFQELEQKPTEKYTMDDLFDLSDDEENDTSTTRNEPTPSNDSEAIEETNSPIVPPQNSQPRIIREKRYIPLDPSIYEVARDNDTLKPTEHTPIDPSPVKKERKEEAAEDVKSNEKSNVFFIDALINLDNNNDRIELISNKDAYKEIIDSPIYAPDEEDLSITSPIIENSNEVVHDLTHDLPLEVTNDEKEEIVIENISEEVKHPDEVIFDENNSEERENLETKKSFDNWVRKKDAEFKKKKSSKKKKKKKDKMPLNAKESLKETDIMASETLAELLINQGRNKKAIKVYERLCLIFPEKSNYFAQIIKNLKEKS